jgi:N-acetylmuramic acid 6-phosphate etherase
MQDRSGLLTELRNPASERLDQVSVEEQVNIMQQQDLQAVAAVGEVTAAIAAAVRLVTDRLRNGGRLFYVGAGTSGRLGILDASEIPPTFRAPPELVQGVIAGGTPAIFAAQEGAEDSADGGAADLRQRQVGAKDVVFGIAAGGTTPYVHGALRYAKSVGAGTIFLSCVQHFPGETEVDVVIRPLTGPEVVTGSTRLKAGTATKLVLNRVTTLAMVGLGKTYGNWMVDVQATNAKLRDRAARIVQTLTGTSRPEAEKLLESAGGHAKTAIAMHKLGVDREKANEALARVGGSLRKATEG